jgi:RNA methyltransferase, TrmH family
MSSTVVSSRDNSLIKSIAALAKSPPARRAGGLCLLEGEHLIESYLDRIGTIDTLVMREDAQSHFSRFAARATRTVVVASQLFDHLSALTTPSGVLALAKLPTPAPPCTRGFVLALDAVQDPGNVGTLIRTAAAAGVDQVWISDDSAFVWSVKTLRAAQGAHFHTQIVDGLSLQSALALFAGTVYATLPRDVSGIRVQSLFDAKFATDALLIVSNEGRGLTQALFPEVDAGLSIPMANRVESLNAAVAGSVALYAMARDKRTI